MHEKGGRTIADQGLKEITDRLTSDVRPIMISQGKPEQQQTGFANYMIGIKSFLKEQGGGVKDLAAQIRAH